MALLGDSDDGRVGTGPAVTPQPTLRVLDNCQTCPYRARDESGQQWCHFPPVARELNSVVKAPGWCGLRGGGVTLRVAGPGGCPCRGCIGIHDAGECTGAACYRGSTEAGMCGVCAIRPAQSEA